MPDISKIKAGDANYNFKDAAAREQLAIVSEDGKAPKKIYKGDYIFWNNKLFIAISDIESGATLIEYGSNQNVAVRSFGLSNFITKWVESSLTQAEYTNVATATHAPGELLYWKGVPCVCTAAIAIGNQLSGSNLSLLTSGNLIGYLSSQKKNVQTAVSDPSPSGNNTSFIDYISQNEQGVISVKKKNVPVMTGATSTAVGAPGLVPTPPAGGGQRFLRSDGSWIESVQYTQVQISLSLLDSTKEFGYYGSGKAITSGSIVSVMPIAPSSAWKLIAEVASDKQTVHLFGNGSASVIVGVLYIL